MYYVYHGYLSPDNYDSSDVPTYQITEFSDSDQVIVFKQLFDGDLHDECSNVIFRIFEGVEKTLTPIEVVTDYELTTY